MAALWEPAPPEPDGGPPQEGMLAPQVSRGPEPEPPMLEALHVWAKRRGVNANTARNWARTGVLDGGPEAARVGHPGVLAVRDGGRWAVARVPLPLVAPETAVGRPNGTETYEDVIAALNARVAALETALRAFVRAAALLVDGEG